MQEIVKFADQEWVVSNRREAIHRLDRQSVGRAPDGMFLMNGIDFCVRAKARLAKGDVGWMITERQ